MFSLNTHPRAFSQTENGLIIEVVKLVDSCSARFPHVGGSLDRVEVVRINIEGDPAKSIEACWVDDRHVVCSANGHTRHIATCGSTHVRFSRTYVGIDSCEKSTHAECICKYEGVASPGEKAVCPVTALVGVVEFVCTAEGKSPSFEYLACPGGVVFVRDAAGSGERYE